MAPAERRRARTRSAAGARLRARAGSTAGGGRSRIPRARAPRRRGTGACRRLAAQVAQVDTAGGEQGSCSDGNPPGSHARALAQLAAREGGFVQRSQVRTRSGVSEAELSIRVPSAKLAAIGRLAPVKSESRSLEDLTAAHRSAGRRLGEAKAQRRELLRSLRRASSEAAIEAIERRRWRPRLHAGAARRAAGADGRCGRAAARGGGAAAAWRAAGSAIRRRPCVAPLPPRERAERHELSRCSAVGPWRAGRSCGRRGGDGARYAATARDCRCAPTFRFTRWSALSTVLVSHSSRAPTSS